MKQNSHPLRHLKNPLPLLLSSLTLASLHLSACAPVQPAPQSTPSASPSSSPSAIGSASPQPSSQPSQPATELTQIGYGLSYGFCMGYCDHSLTITPERMRLVHKALREPEKNPEQVIEKPTPPATWQKLTQLASFQTLQSLPERIGCPDCADGGAEWLELQQAEASKRVTFEPQAGLPQQAELLAELRKQYQQLNTQQPTS